MTHKDQAHKENKEYSHRQKIKDAMERLLELKEEAEQIVREYFEDKSRIKEK